MENAFELPPLAEDPEKEMDPEKIVDDYIRIILFQLKKDGQKGDQSDTNVILRAAEKALAVDGINDNTREVLENFKKIALDRQEKESRNT